MTRRILFVDDDPNLLQGLKRMLRSMRHEWEMAFALGGQEALDQLGRTSFDVIVSDVRMPVINGVQLLEEVKRRFPHTVRILLSGQSDAEMIMSAIGPAHQYLAKPCEADVLKRTINRACMLGDYLSNDRLKQLVAQVETIPPLPSLYLELENELKSSNSSVDRAAAIVAQDISMTAKLLKLVNSAFFGAHRPIADPVQAVLFLGLDTLKTLVLSVKIFEQIGSQMASGFIYDRFWAHSLAVGEYARNIVLAENGDRRMLEETLAAGLLHDLGVLLLASQLPDAYQETFQIAAREQLSLEEAERHTLGATHAEIGAYLLGLWGLSTSVVEAVAFHHNPHSCPTRQWSPLTAVHVANALLHDTTDGLERTGASDEVDMAYLDSLGLSERIATWRDLGSVPV
ncbi:MAG: HDOD domain-containing protein [Nitrospirae bacterium]|nr:MAG: HDOD domain-containing protein [Nitrospirota bacterium]